MTTSDREKHVDIHFMYIDLDTCTRCAGTEAHLDAALDSVASVLQSAGATVSLRKTLVTSTEQAEELAFVSSPTIRVNGRDIALELRESTCVSCGEASGGDEEIDCRVWVYRGEEYTEAPQPMIVDAILSAVYSEDGRPAAKTLAPATTDSRENLARFFAAKANNAGACCGGDVASKGCC